MVGHVREGRTDGVSDVVLIRKDEHGRSWDYNNENYYQ